MLNLLTLEEKKSIKREYRVRTVTTGVAFAFFIVVFGIAGLLPAYFDATVNLKIKKAELENLTLISEQKGDDSVALALTRTDTILKFVHTDDIKSSNATEVIDKTLLARPRGVTINKLSFDNSENGKVVTVTGTALTRMNLIEYSKNLGKQPGFLPASVPAEDLAQTKDINFRLTIKGDF